MQSLSELNNISNTTVTYIDERPSGVNLDYTPFMYYNQLEITSTTVVVNPTVNIVEIINPESANVRYQFIIHSERVPLLSGSSITFGTLPSGVTSSSVGSTYTLSGITTVDQWNSIKQVTWNLPSNYANSPFWYLEVKIIYFDNSLGTDQEYSWLEFDTRFYYFAQMQSTVVLRVPSISSAVGATQSADAELISTFTIEAKTTKSGSVDLYSNFTIVCNIGENPKDVVMNSVFEFSCISSYGYDRTPTYPSIELANIRCRSYMDVGFEYNVLPNYNFGHPIQLTSAFSPEIICRWALLSPVRPTVNLLSNFATISNPSYKYRYTAALVDNSSSLSATGTYDHTYNITAARTYDKNIGTAIFATNTPYLETGFPTATFKIEVSCTIGYLTGESATTPLQLISYTGTYTTINSKFSEIKYYPVKDSTASTTITFKKYRNTVLQQTVSFNLNYSGSVGTIVPSISTFNTAGAFNYTMPLDSYYYGTISYAIIGGGGGGSGSLYYNSISPLPNYGFCKIGNGGWSGSLLVNTNQIMNTSTITNIITGTVGAGGLSSQMKSSSISFAAVPSMSMINSTTNAYMTSIAVNSDGLFVAVGYNAYGHPLYSTSSNGTTWTTPSLMNGSTVPANMTSIAVNSDGLFVAIGTNGNSSNGNTVSSYSSNGTTWTTPTAIPITPGNVISLESITCSKDDVFVAVGYRIDGGGTYGSPAYSISYNGMTWAGPISISSSSFVTNFPMLHSVSIAVNSDGLFVGVGGKKYIVSSNGTTWSGPSEISPMEVNYNSIAVNSDGLFVAVGYDTSVDYRPYYTTSTDGINWSNPAIINNTTIKLALKSITCSKDNIFVAIGWNNYNYPYYTTSIDGTNWTEPTLISSTYGQLNAIAVNSNGLFVGVGSNGIETNSSTRGQYIASEIIIIPDRLSATNGTNSSIVFSDNTTYTATGGRGSNNAVLNTISYKLNNVEQISQTIGQGSDLNTYQYGRGLDLLNSADGSSIQYSILESVGNYEIGHGGDIGQGSTANSNPSALTVNTVTTDLRSAPANHATTLDYNIPGSGGYGGGFIHDSQTGTTYTLQDGGAGKTGAVIFKAS